MINLALIGLGRWGKNYLSAIKSFSNCRIKYICTKTFKEVNNANKDYIMTTDIRKLLDYKDIDGIIIATPGSTHFQLAEKCLNKGFNLLIEKPLTINYEQALQLKKIKDNCQAEVLVGHVYLFDPAFIQMKKMLKQIGALQYISYEAVNYGPFRSDMSVLWDLGPHAISLLLDIYKQNPIKIAAWAQNCLRPRTKLYDIVNLKLEFSNKFSSFVEISWLSPIKRRELTVVGTSSTLIYNDLNSNRLTLFENMGPLLEGEEITKMIPKMTYPSYDHKLPLENELGEFINLLSKKQVINRSDLDFGVRVTYLLKLAEESINRGGEAVNVK